MNHKIDIPTLVDVRYHRFGFIVPTLGIADESKTEFFLIFQFGSDGLNILFIQVLFSSNVSIVRVNFKHITSLKA